MERFKSNREFMKSNWLAFKQVTPDQDKNLLQPPLQKPYDDENARIADLPQVDKKLLDSQEGLLKKADVYKCLKERRSRRKYTEESLSVAELSFLLWATQGVDRVAGKNRYATLRPVASGGARHPFETYVVVNRVEGIGRGVYRYLPLTHQLLFLFEDDNVPQKITAATMGQTFVGEGAVVLIWSCIPYRGEWRYDIAAHKIMLLDAGHVCQNLYLASEVLGCGTCAIGAYNQEVIDSFLKLDGQDEFVVYLAPVGRL